MTLPFMRKVQSTKSARGFTIIELLVATLVFTVVLLIVTTGILQIARVYFKGVTEANTQNTARSIIDTVAQAIQFSGGNVANAIGAVCVGNQQYSYLLGSQVEESPVPAKNQVHHALVSNSLSGCSSATAAQAINTATVSGRDLVGQHMRLSKFSVTNVGTNLYNVQVKVVYGDDDLLDNPTTAAAKCKNILVGTQFCAVSELNTVVVKRVR